MTEADWIRLRLRAEAEDYSELATQAGRVRALELLGKINGVFEAHNSQLTDPIVAILGQLSGSVVSPGHGLTGGSFEDD